MSFKSQSPVRLCATGSTLSMFYSHINAFSTILTIIFFFNSLLCFLLINTNYTTYFCKKLKFSRNKYKANFCGDELAIAFINCRTNYMNLHKINVFESWPNQIAVERADWPTKYYIWSFQNLSFWSLKLNILLSTF